MPFGGSLRFCILAHLATFVRAQWSLVGKALSATRRLAPGGLGTRQLTFASSATLCSVHVLRFFSAFSLSKRESDTLTLFKSPSGGGLTKMGSVTF